jgi:hypothetical protein
LKENILKAKYKQYNTQRDVEGVRDGGAGGGSCPPKKITKSKSRAEWEIKKSKMPKSRAKSGKLKSQKCQKAPRLLGKQRQLGNIRFFQYTIFSGLVCHHLKKSGTFLSAPLNFSFPYANERDL